VDIAGRQFGVAALPIFLLVARLAEDAPSPARSPTVRHMFAGNLDL